MSDDNKCACGMPLNDETKCNCKPGTCAICCGCSSDCECGCQEKAKKIKEDNDNEEEGK